VGFEGGEGQEDFVGEGESEDLDGDGVGVGGSGESSVLLEGVGRGEGLKREGSPSSSSPPPPSSVEPVFVGFGEFEEPVTGFVVPAPAVTVCVMVDLVDLKCQRASNGEPE